MKRISNVFKQMFSGVVKKHLVLPIIVFIVALVFALIAEEYRSMVISAGVGFILGKALVDLGVAIYFSKEDDRKAIRDYDTLKLFYDENTYGNKAIFFGQNKKVKIFYDESFTNDFNTEIVYDDYPCNMHSMPSVIMPYYADLLQAHKASYTKNAITFRLIDFQKKDNQLILKTGRTTYFNHLVLNRAIDFPIRDSFSIRKQFEYNKCLTPLKESELANQIGVNGIILFNDGYTVFPRRGFNATVAKNCITSSLAIRLNTVNPHKKLIEQEIYDDFYLNMKKRLHFKESYFTNPEDIEIIFLGFGRDLCEGGKPQFYYLIKFNKLNSDDYTKDLPKLIKDKKKDKNLQIDFDKTLYLTKFSDLDLQKGQTLKFKPRIYNKSKERFVTKKRFIKVKPEISFFYNLWHYYKIYFPERISIEKDL